MTRMNLLKDPGALAIVAGHRVARVIRVHYQRRIAWALVRSNLWTALRFVLGFAVEDGRARFGLARSFALSAWWQYRRLSTIR